jgi:AcrR family transcriptional regulator
MKEKILKRAIELFNERGVEFIGVRELAADLGVKGGNITYYYPTKEDIIYDAARLLQESNSELFNKAVSPGLLGTLERFQLVFENQYLFRGMFLSFNHLMHTQGKLRDAYRESQRIRRADIEAELRQLIDEKYLDRGKAEPAISSLYNLLSMIGRFWISDSSIQFPQGSFEERVAPYLKAMVQLFEPYATAKGKRNIENFRKKMNFQ